MHSQSKMDRSANIRICRKLRPAMPDADYFIEKADQCLILSKMAGSDRELARMLRAMADEFMAKAVEIDTEREKNSKAPCGH
jgi:hypothetical protein